MASVLTGDSSLEIKVDIRLCFKLSLIVAYNRVIRNVQ